MYPLACNPQAKDHLGLTDADGFLRSARVISQPGDGSCLFHSLCYALCDGTTALELRKQVAKFIEQNPDLPIADTPLRNWVFV